MARRPSAAALVAAMLLPAVLLFPAVVMPASPGPHITDLNILLPPRMTNPVEYRLQGSDGCFKWSWDHHDILSVQPEYNVSSKCSTSARLKSTASYSGRKETSVYATDLITGTTIRCKVFIDIVSRIQIFHHSIKIDLDELAALQIRAFDDEENVFSSLVGLQFLWKLAPKSGKADKAQNHLIHVPLKETPLSDCGGFCGDLDTQIEIEDTGLGSDLYVVKGIEIGQEIVTAQLFEPHHEHVVDSIVLTVAEAMSLDPPSPVFVTVGSVIKYKIRVIRLNTARVIELPSENHQWSVTNSSVAWVDNKLGIAQALDLGLTYIIVEDMRISGHAQSSALHVVIPREIRLYLLPTIKLNDLNLPEGTESIISLSSVWYVFPGQEYVILVKVFAAESQANEMYITEKNELKLESSTYNHWDISTVSDDIRSKNDWINVRLLSPISLGRGFLTASITYKRNSLEQDEVLKHVQEVRVCDKVKLYFQEQKEYLKTVRLPWAPGIFQEIKLNPIGGCGVSLDDYKWFSSDESIVSVSASGVAYAKNPGSALVKAVSVLDSLNYDVVLVEISFPSSMVFVPIFPVEVVVGTQLTTAVTLKTSNGEYFTRCDAFSSSVRWRVISEKEPFKIIDKKEKIFISNTKEGSPCSWIALNAYSSGQATIAATLSFGQTVLKTTSLISSYFPLVIYQAENGNEFGGYWVNVSNIQLNVWDKESTGLNELYLAPWSIMDIVLFGGPERWSQRVEFVEKMDILNQTSKLVIHDLLVQPLSLRRFRVSCQTRGNFKLRFSRGNLVGDDHPVPAIATTELAVVCDIPTSIILFANEHENTIDVLDVARKADRNAKGLQTSPAVVSNGQTIRVAAVSVHATERYFANSSSLCLRWELIGCEGLADWDGTKDFESFEGPKWEKFLILHNMTGLCIVRASVVGFLESIAHHLHLEAGSITVGTGENDLTDSLQLQVVSSLRVIPETLLLVFNPESKASLTVTGGTCFLETSVNDTQVVKIIKHPQGTHCKDLVLGATGLGSALVLVHDIGLSPPSVAFATVRVANIEWIKIISPEQISLLEGETRDFEIMAGSQDGSTFDYSQYIYMDIEVHIDDEIIELINITTMRDLVPTRNQYSVKALNLGITSFYVSARQQSGSRIFSQLVKVEVYKSLRLHPEYIYLVPGASYVFTVEGGPKLETFVEYSSLDDRTAKVNNTSGKVLAESVGNATMRAAVLSGSGSVISEAYGRVEIGIPSAMSLNFQSDKLCIGCSMPIFPAFTKGNLFSFYNICQAQRWMIQNEEVVRFESARSVSYNTDKEKSLEEKGYPSSGNTYINVLIGRSAGKSEVSVSISCKYVSSSGSSISVLYNASNSVTVVQDPPLALGLPFTWILPPFYTFSHILPTFNDSFGRSTTAYTLLRPCDRNEISKGEFMNIDGSRIVTGRSGDIACIQVKDQASGRAEIGSCVRVSKVSQVRISATKYSIHQAFLAVGAKFELNIKYTDDLGYVFAEANGVVPVDIEINYPDVVSVFVPKDETNKITNTGIVVLEAKHPGTALVRININGDPTKADFLMVLVGAHMYPKNPTLHVGQYLNFTFGGDGIGMDESLLGYWKSGNESVIYLNRISGEAHALGEGIAEVIFEGPNVKLKTPVTVLKINQIIVDPPIETLTNIPFPSDGYKFRVRFSDPAERKIEVNHISVPYDCKVEPDFVGYSKPWTDRLTSTTYCLFFPYTPIHLFSVLSKSKVESSDLGSMQISIFAFLRDDPKVTGSVKSLFIGGFSIEEVRKLNLTHNNNRSIITITGNTDIELSWNAKDLFLVRLVRKNQFGIIGHAEYQVEALKRKSFTDKIVIVLPATGQKAEIDVSYEDQGRPTTTQFSTRSTITAIAACCLVLAITVLLFLKLFDRPTWPSRSAAATGQLSSAVTPIAGPATPDRPSVFLRTPQSSPCTEPFVDYVRRTIDETPFYKRDGRRRFDPQKTY